MRDSRTEILRFWFEETAPVQWFQKNSEFDDTIRERFLDVYNFARDGVYDEWMHNEDGTLALCILLDQFPRNMFRGDARAFATDDRALEIAKQGIASGFDQILSPLRRRFLYLPFEHSENIADQDESVAFFAGMKMDDPVAYEYALRHRDVIRRFGRFPHRNTILGRQSSDEEVEYLSHPDAGF